MVFVYTGFHTGEDHTLRDFMCHLQVLPPIWNTLSCSKPHGYHWPSQVRKVDSPLFKERRLRQIGLWYQFLNHDQSVEKQDWYLGQSLANLKSFLRRAREVKIWNTVPLAPFSRVWNSFLWQIPGELGRKTQNRTYQIGKGMWSLLLSWFLRKRKSIKRRGSESYHRQKFYTNL